MPQGATLQCEVREKEGGYEGDPSLWCTWKGLREAEKQAEGWPVWTLAVCSRMKELLLGPYPAQE